MPRRLELDPDRLFPADPSTRAIARSLYGQVAGLSVINPHGHTDPAWFADDIALALFGDGGLFAASWPADPHSLGMIRSILVAAG